MQYPIVKNPMVWDDRTTWRKLIAVARDWSSATEWPPAIAMCDRERRGVAPRGDWATVHGDGIPGNWWERLLLRPWVFKIIEMHQLTCRENGWKHQVSHAKRCLFLKKNIAVAKVVARKSLRPPKFHQLEELWFGFAAADRIEELGRKEKRVSSSSKTGSHRGKMWFLSINDGFF